MLLLLVVPMLQVSVQGEGRPDMLLLLVVPMLQASGVLLILVVAMPSDINEVACCWSNNPP